MPRNDLYVRNARPNMIVFSYANQRYKLEHRGNRADSTALPKDALYDPTISRWLKTGYLEKISEESFMKLGQRRIDTLPNEFVLSQRDKPAKMYTASEANSSEANTTGMKTHIKDGEVHKLVREQVSPKWAGDLMSTEEELETMPQEEENRNYPSKHREDEEVRRQMGY